MERIKGSVVPADWDSNGNVISLSIATGNEQEYLIENHRQIANLWTFLRQEVVVIGSIKSRKEHMIINVAKIQRGEVNNSYYKLILNKEWLEKKNWKFRTNQIPEQLLPIAIFK